MGKRLPPKDALGREIMVGDKLAVPCRLQGACRLKIETCVAIDDNYVVLSVHGKYLDSKRLAIVEMEEV